MSPTYFKTFVMWAEIQLCFFLGNLCQISTFVRGVYRSVVGLSRTRCSLRHEQTLVAKKEKKLDATLKLKRECYLKKY